MKLSSSNLTRSKRYLLLGSPVLPGHRGRCWGPCSHHSIPSVCLVWAGSSGPWVVMLRVCGDAALGNDSAISLSPPEGRLNPNGGGGREWRLRRAWQAICHAETVSKGDDCQHSQGPNKGLGTDTENSHILSLWLHVAAFALGIIIMPLWQIRKLRQTQVKYLILGSLSVSGEARLQTREVRLSPRLNFCVVDAPSVIRCPFWGLWLRRFKRLDTGVNHLLLIPILSFLAVGFGQMTNLSEPQCLHP